MTRRAAGCHEPRNPADGTIIRLLAGIKLRLTAQGQRVHDALEENFDTWADRLLA
jgi:hypothetical protein